METSWRKAILIMTHWLMDLKKLKEKQTMKQKPKGKLTTIRWPKEKQKPKEIQIMIHWLKEIS